VPASRGGLFLMVRLGSELAALPVADVSETLRPLPIEPFATAPDFVLGTSIVRGVPILARLLSGSPGPKTRFVVVKTAGRRVALAVEAVVGFRTLAEADRTSLPSLLANGAPSAVDAIGALDSELYLVLAAARLLPEGAGLLEGAVA
jgi:purine-binding chemotaxis protein CheW